MRIAVVHSFYSKKSPSGENVVVEMQVDALRESGHEVDLVSVNSDDLSASPAYNVKTALGVATGTGLDPTERLQRFDPQVVHVHNLFPNFSTRWLDIWTGPLVNTIHNFRSVCAAGIIHRDGHGCTLCPDKGQIHSLIHKCYRGSRLATLPLAIRNRRGVNDDALLRRTDAAIFLSERARTQYSSFGYDPEYSHVLPNFVIPATGGEQPESGSPWAYVGRLTPEKGIAKLLQYWPTSVPLDIYGDGPERDRVRSYCKGQISYRGSVSRTQILEKLQNSGGLVIPSIWSEGMPTVYLEALAAGLPVLAKTGNSAADDILRSGGGKVFEDWEEIPRLLADIGREWTKYAVNSRARYVGGYSRKIWLSGIEQVYDRAISINRDKYRK